MDLDDVDILFDLSFNQRTKDLQGESSERGGGKNHDRLGFPFSEADRLVYLYLVLGSTQIVLAKAFDLKVSGMGAGPPPRTPTTPEKKKKKEDN
jgi:hypothetical protein